MQTRSSASGLSDSFEETAAPGGALAEFAHSDNPRIEETIS